MEAPLTKATLVNDFFEGALDVEKMAGKVDASLYREKIKTKEIIR